MDVRTLRWFQLAVDGTTLTDIAAIEMVTQPVVSRALERLGEDVGAPLLRKSGRVLRPTAAGAAFKRHVDEALHRLDDGLAAVAQAVDPEAGAVRLGFQLSLASWLVPDLVRGFRGVHPGVAFTLSQVRDVDVEDRLANGEVDIVLSTARPGESVGHRVHLVTEALEVAVPSEHPLAGRATIAIADLADDDFLLLRAPTSLRRRTEELCAAAGFAPRVSFEGDDLPTLLGFVSAGLGVAVIPAGTLAAGEGGSPRIARLALTDARASRGIGMSWPTRFPLLPSAELFRRHVLASAADLAVRTRSRPPRPG